MPRQEQFAVALALVVAAISMFFVQKIAAGVLAAGGIAVAANIYVKDWLYGRERHYLTRDVIDRMAASEYKRRFANPRFRRWVDRLYRER